MDEAAKRKRLSDPEGQPDAKRPAQDQQQPAITKDPRAALAEVYAAYDALHRNAYTDDKDIKAGEAHFAVLLSALQGNEAVQRLAIRLLPKFAPRFPCLISDAAAALQGLSSLNINNNNTSNGNKDTSNGDTVDISTSTVPYESLLGLKKMLLAGKKNLLKSSAAAEGALHFALQQQIQANSGDTPEERRTILNEVAKAAFISCPRAVFNQIIEFSSGSMRNDAAVELQQLALEFVEKHLLAKVQDQESDIQEAFRSMHTRNTELGINGIGDEEEKLGEDEAHLTVLHFVILKNKIHTIDDDGTTWFVSSLQTLLQHSKSQASSSTTLIEGLRQIIETLAPKRPSPPAAATTTTTTGAAGSKRRRSRTDSPSPKPTTHRSGRSNYGNKSAPSLPPLGSSRPPRERTSPLTGAGTSTRKERGSNKNALPPPYSERDTRGTTKTTTTTTSKWMNSRGPTPTLEEGELGELDEGELLPPSQSQQPPIISSSQKQDKMNTTTRRSRSPGREERMYRDGREGRDGERERGRRRGSYSPPPPLPYSDRDRSAANHPRSDRDRDYRGERADRGDRGGPPPTLSSHRDTRPTSASHQKVPGRGMPPLEYAGKALWVGQVPLGHAAERELVDAFARYGPLMSHHIIARSSCAFINYVDVECAIEAREKLDGARVAGSTLVVEFKGEKKYWEKREREKERGRGVERGDRGGDGRDSRDAVDYRERDRGGGEYTRASPFIAGGLSPVGPAGPSRRTRSRSKSPIGASRRRSFDGGRLYSVMSEQLPSLPLPRSASQQQKPQQLPHSSMHPPLAAAGAGATTAGAAIAWQGRLGKSRQPQAEVACLYPTSSYSPSSSWAAAEPAGWPAMLDVQNRISTAYVLNTLLPTLPPAERAVLRLIPAPGQTSEAARLQAFSSYLQGKQRTGVVTLGPGPQPGAPRIRVVYLIPASEEACRSVGMVMDGDVYEGMIAVVAAKSDEA